ncbi:unnamed protein product, partial [Owenia fusiformis]
KVESASGTCGTSKDDESAYDLVKNQSKNSHETARFLMHKYFTEQELIEHSLTGKTASRSNVSRPPLNQGKVRAILGAMERHCGISTSEAKQKLQNIAKPLRAKLKKN